MTEWTRCFHPSQEPRARLVCFPHAGGSASAFHPLSKGLAERGVETRAVQYPGRQDRYREPFFEKVDALVETVVEELSPLADEGIPLAFFGHSMGAVLAFEAVRRLEREGRRPAALFASASQAPSLPWPPPGTPSARGADDAALTEDLRLLSEGTSPVLQHPALLELALPALRADFLMLEGYEYTPGEQLDCPVVALAGDRDPRVPVDSVGPWEKETAAGFHMRVMPGGHFYLEDQLPQVVEEIVTRI
ncbi:thioesterase [Nocardiopsis sp. HNM0947]|uniref:Thioesterase n=1 Tax=Nocardiopsis coralli TaxID=2772213 RepID=A0ABR9P173_9ACTN|nr:alpha/beta fold hydrolase [Nocardiopsis coralli]MBE2997588.1 thioesterase [Nocardiopsis coralli]